MYAVCVCWQWRDEASRMARNFPKPHMDGYADVPTACQESPDLIMWYSAVVVDRVRTFCVNAHHCMAARPQHVAPPYGSP